MTPNLATCGEDFCDRCGDCLGCYGSDECPYGGWHIWPVVTYREVQGSRCETCQREFSEDDRYELESCVNPKARCTASGGWGVTRKDAIRKALDSMPVWTQSTGGPEVQLPTPTDRIADVVDAALQQWEGQLTSDLSIARLAVDVLQEQLQNAYEAIQVTRDLASFVDADSIPIGELRALVERARSAVLRGSGGDTNG